jgi:hypothetical protein
MRSNEKHSVQYSPLSEDHSAEEERTSIYLIFNSDKRRGVDRFKLVLASFNKDIVDRYMKDPKVHDKDEEAQGIEWDIVEYVNYYTTHEDRILICFESSYDELYITNSSAFYSIPLNIMIHMGASYVVAQLGLPVDATLEKVNASKKEMLEEHGVTYSYCVACIEQ